MAYTFRGGAHVREFKNTADCPIEKMDPPQTVKIPMSQHIGLHCTPTVKVGDRVFYGQKIGDIEAGLGCPVHSSVSGTVKAIEAVNDARGIAMKAVVIENDGLYTLSPDVAPYGKPLSETSPDEIVDIIRSAGISGMGGATFPTHAKLRGAIGRAKNLIINCAECEPYITANHRLMLECPEEVVGGAEILMHALGLNKCTLAVEDNKMNAIKVLRKYIKSRNSGARVAVLKTKYPQGDERQIIYALLKKELPAGKLPADLGCVFFNAETCAAVYHAFYFGTPLLKRIVTVDGDCIAQPKNVFVHIGTPYSALIDFCGGLKKSPKKIINGGPMMGFAQWDINAPVTKGTSAILAFSSESELKYGADPVCIHCGRCVEHCPMHLMPNYLAAYSKAGRYDEAEKFGAMICVECGTCSYNCPGQVPIVQYIRVAKSEIKVKQMQAKNSAVGK